MAQEAISPFSILAFLSEKAPVNGDSSRVPRDGLDHAPDQQDEEYVKNDEKDDEGCGSESKHVLEDVDVVIEEDETDHTDKVRIAESSQAHLLNNY